MSLNTDPASRRRLQIDHDTEPQYPSISNDSINGIDGLNPEATEELQVSITPDKPMDSPVDDTDHEDTVDNSPAPKKKYAKAITAFATAALAAGGTLLALNNLGRDDEPTPEPNPAATEPGYANPDATPNDTNPGDSPDVGPSHIPNLDDEPLSPEAVPAEAYDFVAIWGDMYTDPVATYYSAEDYIEMQNQSPVIDIDTLELYDYEFPRLARHENSVLGFEMVKLPYDAEVSNESFKQAFDDFAQKCLTPYMNLRGKNPDPGLIDIIDHEFAIHCGNVNNQEHTYRLMSMLNEIVDQYGSTATFRVLPITGDRYDPDGSYRDDRYPPEIDHDDAEGNPQAYQGRVDLAIEIHERDANGDDFYSVEKRELVSIQLTRTDQPGSKAGYVAIGMR